MADTTNLNDDPDSGDRIVADIITDQTSNNITDSTTQFENIDSNYSLVLSDEVLETIFKKIDLNNDGLIDLNELKTHLASIDASHLPKGFAREVLNRADKNEDKSISLEEFLKLCHNDSWLPNQTFLNFCELVTLPIRNRRKRVRYEDMMSCSPIPIFIISVSFLQLIIFINDQRAFLRQKWAQNNNEDVDRFFSTISQYLLFKGNKMIEVWRFLTYMLVHENVGHIVSNLILQLVAGIPIESVHGWWRILIIYLASGLAGSVAVESLSNCTALVGSSAGAYGLLGAHFSTLLMNWNEMDHKLIRLLIVTVYVVVDVVVSVNLTINKINNTVLSHLFGFIIGFLVGNIVIKNLVTEDYEKTIWLVSSICVALLFSTGIFLIAFIPN